MVGNTLIVCLQALHVTAKCYFVNHMSSLPHTHFFESALARSLLKGSLRKRKCFKQVSFCKENRNVSQQSKTFSRQRTCCFLTRFFSYSRKIFKKMFRHKAFLLTQQLFLFLNTFVYGPKKKTVFSLPRAHSTYYWVSTIIMLNDENSNSCLQLKPFFWLLF